MEVIILAAGEGKRHPMRAKQLLVVGEETIIARIVRQCRDRGSYPIVTTNDDRILEELERIGVHSLRPDKTRWLVETMLDAHMHWGEHTCVLLGDVIYSQSTMNRIFRNRRYFAWYGDEAESYALLFNRRWHNGIIKAIKKMFTMNYPEYQGTIRQLVHELCNTTDITIFDHEFSQRVHDYTRDIDTHDDWKKFQAEVIKRHDLDDKP